MKNVTDKEILAEQPTEAVRFGFLSGDVYNLPGGSKILVKDQQEC